MIVELFVCQGHLVQISYNPYTEFYSWEIFKGSETIADSSHNSEEEAKTYALMQFRDWIEVDNS